MSDDGIRVGDDVLSSTIEPGMARPNIFTICKLNVPPPSTFVFSIFS